MPQSYGLALWGWASRWLAHIWILQYIEENNLTIDEISWTSMWAIIAGCFASGKSSAEIIKILEEINFLSLLDINFKEALVSGDKVYALLEKVYGNTKIEDTKIPLKIIATNLHTWEKTIFSSGKIADAVRASISLPSIFRPFKQEKDFYLDGGLKSNLPILSLKSKNIIAVSVIRGEQKKIRTHKKVWNFLIQRSFWTYNYDILKQTITHLMTQNEDAEIEIARLQGKNVILLCPKVGDYEYFDFLKYPEIIQKWYDEMKGLNID